MSWLKKAVDNIKKPKESVIEVLRRNLNCVREGRDRSQLHASDITKENFCARKWCLNDLQQVKSVKEYLPTALSVTYSLGTVVANTLIEEWAGDSVIGDWECLKCNTYVSMTTNPGGFCNDKKKHLWKYNEVVFESSEYGVSGSIDAIFNLGSSYWRVAELKILAADAYDKIIAPQSEHRIRTSLYLRLIEESSSVWKSKFNLERATVLYVSRGYGRLNPDWGEILPFKEFEIIRDDTLTDGILKQAKALKIFRKTRDIPTGICGTALDVPAKNCSVCKSCFSGDYKASFNWKEL